LAGSPAHLLRRFVDYLTAPPLTRSEIGAVTDWLTPGLAGLFFQQNAPDQRHAYHAALTVVASGVTDRDVIVSALMHDVGKRHARLGVVGRSIASVLIALGASPGDRMTVYRDHGIIGARELADRGAPALAIDFALHHQRDRPATIDPAVWSVLMRADQPPKTSTMLKRRITSAGI
jgi:hypothetical protein